MVSGDGKKSMAYHRYARHNHLQLLTAVRKSCSSAEKFSGPFLIVMAQRLHTSKRAIGDIYFVHANTPEPRTQTKKVLAAEDILRSTFSNCSLCIWNVYHSLNMGPYMVGIDDLPVSLSMSSCIVADALQE